MRKYIYNCYLSNYNASKIDMNTLITKSQQWYDEAKQGEEIKSRLAGEPIIPQWTLETIPVPEFAGIVILDYVYHHYTGTDDRKYWTRDSIINLFGLPQKVEKEVENELYLGYQEWKDIKPKEFELKMQNLFSVIIKLRKIQKKYKEKLPVEGKIVD